MYRTPGSISTLTRYLAAVEQVELYVQSAPSEPKMEPPAHIGQKKEEREVGEKT